MRILLTLTKKELNYYLNSSLGYVVIVPFLLISFFLYFRTAFIYGSATLRPFFDVLPWFLVLLGPALTMNSLVEEKVKNTLEILLAHPLNEFSVVFSKFFGSLLFYLIILCATLPLILPLFIFSRLDAGLILSQYLGAIFTGGVFLAVGIFASSVSVNQIASFLSAVFISLVLVFLGLDFVSLSVPQPFGSFLASLGVLNHNQGVSRGLLDLTDLLYLLTVASLFLIASVYKISGRKIAESAKEKRKLQVSFFSIVIIGLLLNAVFNKVPLRLDLTQDRVFSLSAATKNVLSRVDDVLTIKIFASSDLPVSAQNVLRETEDILRDYQHFGKKIKVERLYPLGENEATKEAQSSGITPLQFNTIGQTSYQLQSGFLGLALRFGEKSEAIPFIQETQSLEYNLTRKISRLTSKSLKRISFYSDYSQSAPDPTDANGLKFRTFLGELQNQYELSETKLDKEFIQKPDLLIVLGLKKTLEKAKTEVLKKYMSAGGKTLLLLDKNQVDQESVSRTVLTTGLEDFLNDYGLNLPGDLVFDRSLAETIQVGQGPLTFLVPYPFWIKTLPTSGNLEFLSQIRSVSLLWPSSLNLSSKEGFISLPLLKTSRNGGKLTGDNISISPDRLNEISFGNKGEETTLGALVKEKDGENRVAVVTDSEFIADNYLSGSSESLSFILSLTDFLTLGEKEVVALKRSSFNPFVFSYPWQPVLVQWSELIGVPLLVSLYGFLRLAKRKRSFSRVYSPQA